MVGAMWAVCYYSHAIANFKYRCDRLELKLNPEYQDEETIVPELQHTNFLCQIFHVKICVLMRERIIFF